MIKAAGFMLLLCLTGASAVAQTADTPVMGSSGTVEDGQNQVTSILVLGDKLGGGLGAGLTRVGEADGRYEVVNRFNEEAGLARPEVYDWAETIPKILESDSYDVIVFLAGTNDRQTIRSGNLRFAFSSPEWVAAYRQQVARVADVLTASEARIFWVSIPPMADEDYDAAMRVIAGLQQETVEAKGISFVDIRKSFLSADGEYTDIGPDDTGDVRKLRGSDGVSFYKQGNNLLGKLVLEAIESKEVPVIAAAKPVVPSQIAPARDERVIPLFGQTAFMGEMREVSPKDVRIRAALVVGRGANPLPASKALAAIRALAAPGSAAERLFVDGQPSPAPRGRADDFSLPAVATE